MKRVVEKKTKKDEIALQCRLFTEFPFPARTRKIKMFYDNNNKPIMEGYLPKWEKKIGSRKVKIIADPEHGFPHGNDILVILYLIKEARKQNDNGLITFKSINDFLRAFDYGCDQPNRKTAYSAFQRIFYSTWYYEDEHRKKKFNVMGYCELFPEDGLFTGDEYQNKIALTPEFWEYIHNYPVPYSFDAVLKLKKSPMALNLYLLLVYRTWMNWKVEKTETFIPFFSESGLKHQLSSEISSARHFREKFKSWLKQIKEVWPDCPVYLKKESQQLKTGRVQRTHIDGLFIHTTSPSQLHVPPHWGKELRLAQEEGKKVAAEQEKKLKNRLTRKQEDFILSHGSEELIQRMEAGELTKKDASEFIGETIKTWQK